MHLYGLIGFPLSHSFSKKYFSEKFEQEGIKNHRYSLYPLESIDDLPLLLEADKDLRGLNVTIPYKEDVPAFLDEIDAEAAAVGAVNTIKITEGKLKGFNTDVYGFEQSLLGFVRRVKSEKKLLKIPPFVNTPIQEIISEQSEKKGLLEGLKALILGTGGAAKAVAFVLQKHNIPFKFVSRRPQEGQLSYSDLRETQSDIYRLIINTTPLGMSPKTNTCPDIPYEKLSAEHYLFDLVYNPSVTEFLRRGKERGAAVQNGLEMLHLQAERAWEIWNS